LGSGQVAELSVDLRLIEGEVLGALGAEPALEQ
jgi:hypothetical protein